ncbi:MAG: epoxyqueuosine reductase [Bacillota bacterium]
MNYETIVEEMNKFVKQSPLNVVQELGIDRIFEPPLIGIAAADDPLFQRLKEPTVVGDAYILPGEWLDGAQSVISYFLPFTEKIRQANRKKVLPALEWLYGRIEGQKFNAALSTHIMDKINNESSDRAIAPSLDSRFEVKEGFISSWSERHTAYIAGLGTFSLSRSLITEKGCAGRYGSIVTSLNLPVTERSYNELYEHCSFCEQCLERCPSRAIKPTGEKQQAGMEKSICREYINKKIKPRFEPRYGCGKCQTAVQCEAKIPERVR